MSKQWGHGYHAGVIAGGRKRKYRLYKFEIGWLKYPDLWKCWLFNHKITNHNADGLTHGFWRGYIIQFFGFLFYISVDT